MRFALAAAALLLASTALAQSSYVSIQDDGVTQGLANTLNCTGALACASSSGKATFNVAVGGGVAPPALACSAGQCTTYDGTDYQCTSTITASDVNCTGCVSDVEVVDVAGAKVTGTVAEATHAGTADALSANPTDCGGAAGTQFADHIDANGNLSCSFIATAPGGGIVLQSDGLKLNPECTPGDVMQSAGATWSCASPEYALGSQLTCPAGNFVTCNGTVCSCSAQATYSAGAGLSLAGTVFSCNDATGAAKGCVTTGAQTFAGDKTFAGSIYADAASRTLSRFTMLQSGYVETQPVNFRFDQDVLRYVNRRSGVTVTLNGFTSNEADILFSQYANLIVLSGKADGSSIEVTGFSFNNSANSAWYPYVLLHANMTNPALPRVVMEVKTTGSALWQLLYDGPVTASYKIAEVASTGGSLTGARWTFYPGATSPIYVRSLGVIGRNSDGYQWSVMKGGDMMFGDLTMASGYKFSGPLTGNVTGNASTASALSADPPNCAPNQFAQGITVDGTATCAQPAFTDLSGAATDAQLPATITASRVLKTAAFSDATTYTVGKGTPVGLGLNLCHNGTSALCTSMNIMDHAHSSSAGSGGLLDASSLGSGTLGQARGGTGAAALTCSAGQALTSNGTAYSCTSSLTASDVVCAGTCVADAEIAGVSGAKVSGAVASATSASTATALAANPSDCAAAQYATTIDAGGNLTCAYTAVKPSFGITSYSNGVGLLSECGNTSVLQYDSGTIAWGCATPQAALAKNLSCSSGQAVFCNGTSCSCTSTIAASDLACTNCVASSEIASLVADKITGTLGQAFGGTGAGALTCTSGAQVLTSNGTSYSCTGDTGWTNVSSFTNSWVNYDVVNNYPAAYRKDAAGVVHLRGVIKSGTVAAAAFTLPVGYRPSKGLAFAGHNSGATGWVSVNASGTVVPSGGNTYVYLDTVQFFPD